MSNKTETTTKSIAQAKKLKIARATINGEAVKTLRASLGDLKHDNHKRDGVMNKTVLLDLSAFSYMAAIPQSALDSDKLEVTLVIERVPGE